MTRIKSKLIAGAALISGALALIGTGTAEAATANLFMAIASQGSNCMIYSSALGLKLRTTDASGNDCRTGTYHYAYLSIPWGPNPGPTQSVNVHTVQPTNSTICSRVYNYRTNGTFFGGSSEVCGGGNKEHTLGVAAGNLKLLVKMRSTSSSATPELVSVSSQVYSQ